MNAVQPPSKLHDSTTLNGIISSGQVQPFQLFSFPRSYPSCSGARAPGLAADMHFKSDVIAFVGPACLFALEPVARLAAYWNTPIITGMGDQPPTEGELSVTSGILGRLQKWNKSDSAVSK